MTSAALSNPRIKVFVDYWNFQLLVNQMQRKDKITLDWKILGEWLATQAAAVAKASPFNYEGVNVYTSYNPKKDAAYHDWIQRWLNRQPGVQVYCFERKPKYPPQLPRVSHSD